MTFFSKRKRKNDDPPRFPAWILVLIAVGMVVIIAILFQSTSRNASASSEQVVSPTVDANLELTGTYIITQATALAQGTPPPTAVILNDNLHPIELTATEIVRQATAQKAAELTSTPKS